MIETMSTTITPQTQLPRGADRRQRSDNVEVDRRTQERRIESSPKTKESAAPDATNFSPEALELSAQPQEQASLLTAARGQLQLTLGNLLQTSDVKATDVGTAAAAGAAAGAVAGAAVGGAAAKKSPASTGASVKTKDTPAANPTPPVDNARQDDWNQRQANYDKRAKEMDSVVGTKNDTLRNLKITQDYSKLSKEMREMLGPDSGANWPTFATWASRQAGETIRQEDLGATAKFGKDVVDTVTQLPFVGPIVSPLVAPAKAGSDLYNISSDQVAKGNRKVYKEIAPQFARFIETFKGDKAPDPEKLKKFQEGFKNGDVSAGGQNGLKEAFNNYYKAMFEKDPDKKKELMFLANGQIGGHEQTRLQPEIQGALPYGTRGLATDWMMKLGLPDGRGGVKPVALGDDVPTFNNRRAPKELVKLDNPDAAGMVKRWDRSPDSLKGSGAEDWTNMRDRMNYILDLFRSRQDDPALFQDPFTPKQTKDILANRIPNLAA